MLEENERAEYMIDVTKYLMYKATGKDYGVTELDLDDISAIDESKFVSTFGTGFWWPIGSEETTEKDGKTFASGEPTTTVITSGVGPRWGEYHEGLDIAPPGTGLPAPGPYIVASSNGIVTHAEDGYEDNRHYF